MGSVASIEMECGCRKDVVRVGRPGFVPKEADNHHRSRESRENAISELSSYRVEYLGEESKSTQQVMSVSTLTVHTWSSFVFQRNTSQVDSHRITDNWQDKHVRISCIDAFGTHARWDERIIMQTTTSMG